MAVRTFEDVVEIMKPPPDSQYRLRPCSSCGSSEVVYAGYMATVKTGTITQCLELWRVVCMDCRATVDLKSLNKHAAQVEWNQKNGGCVMRLREAQERA